ncbi:hypothetical protein [Kitasatospora phosalacinea]|uniref:hypothetical protein n=1 Tax=Kitasatospora phosalacinea TaxID=2065 RepID=UPI000AA7D573|nr:hypothetical protein [Kitasatospora phosalacinea]
MTERGLSMRDPGAAALGRLVANMQRGDSHLIVERFGADEPAGDWYVQVRLRENGVYQLEYRDGVPAEHYRTLTVSPAKVVSALVGWSEGRAAWRAGFDWTNIGHWFADGQDGRGGEGDRGGR